MSWQHRTYRTEPFEPNEYDHYKPKARATMAIRDQSKPKVSDAQIRLNYETKDEWLTAVCVFVDATTVNQLSYNLKAAENLKQFKTYSYKVPAYLGTVVGDPALGFLAHTFVRDDELKVVYVVEVRKPTNEDLRTVSKWIIINGDLGSFNGGKRADAERLAEIERAVAEDVAAVELTTALAKTEAAARK